MPCSHQHADELLMRTNSVFFIVACLFLTIRGSFSVADDAKKLEPMDAATVAAQARLRGDPKRGALIFYTSAAACVNCHARGKDASPLGPDLTTIARDATDQYIVESILEPSKAIRKGFETVSVVTIEGEVKSGLVAADTKEHLTLRDAANLEQEIQIAKSAIGEIVVSKSSMMPNGLVASLDRERDLYDLVRYVTEVARGGERRAAELQPDPQDLIVRDDLANLDHAGILRSLRSGDFDAGKRIYLAHCKDCHGTDGNTPSLPTARAFGKQPLKYGADPYKMLLTLTNGAGLMTPVQYLSPKERYQVVHYIREAFMKPSNPAYREVDEGYLDSLPKGTSDGAFVHSTKDRDYGPVLGSQIGSDVNNALTFRLPDNVTVSYDLHRMRLVGAWTDGFLDLSQTQHYRQRGERMPQIDGERIPGLSDWQWAFDDSFEIPRDAKLLRGPVRADWLQYYGHYLHGDRTVLSFGIHGRKILETVHTSRTDDRLTLHHTLRINAGAHPLKLCVARLDGGEGPVGLMGTENSNIAGRSGPATNHVAVVSGKVDARSSRPKKANQPEPSRAIVAASVTGDTDGTTWEIDDSGRIVLSIPRDDRPRVMGVLRSTTADASLDAIHRAQRSVANEELVDPLVLTRGGPPRWPQTIEGRGKLGEPVNGYALDTIPLPSENPWNAWLRTSALDFFDDGRAVVTTYGGDVYVVSGIDRELDRVVWKRFAAGLFEPFGVRVVNGTVHVTCRDGLKRLHDTNDDGEADFVEAFWIDDDVSCHFHAFNFDLQTDSEGNFYFAKCGRGSHHHRPGTVMRIPPEGGRAEILSWGLRVPNGMGKLNDDRFTVSDNQGHSIPAGKISLVRPGSFMGNMPYNDEQRTWTLQRHGGKLPETFDEPIIWTPQELDNSGGSQVWVDDRRFGPLAGRLIHSSFGKGWLYYLSLQEVKDKMQAAIIALPHQWDAGVMRLRVNPADGQLYGTGMSGWDDFRGVKDGCLQRLRYTGGPVKMVDSVRVVPNGLELSFNFIIDSKTACDPHAWRGEMWDYLWSQRYGSDQYSVLKPGEKGVDGLSIKSVGLINENTVRLNIPNLHVCDQVSLKMNFQDARGETFVEHVYLTIHAIPK
jgi:putative heme-binding domain-containing protein